MFNLQMSFHVIYKAPCGLCLRNMGEIQNYLFQTRCDFIFLEMFCLDPYVLVDRPFQPQRPFYYIPDITSGKEDIPLSCVNEIDTTPPPNVKYSKDQNHFLPNVGLFHIFIQFYSSFGQSFTFLNLSFSLIFPCAIYLTWTHFLQNLQYENIQLQ